MSNWSIRVQTAARGQSEIVSASSLDAAQKHAARSIVFCSAKHKLHRGNANSLLTGCQHDACLNCASFPPCERFELRGAPNVAHAARLSARRRPPL